MIPVRGSTDKQGVDKGGAQALAALRRKLKEGQCIAVTPDGPRGPKYEVQDGVVWLAAKTGVSVAPASYNSNSHFELKNWDRTQLPLPFSEGEFIFGEPLTISSDTDKRTFEESRTKIRNAMMAITERDH
jgi:lysophospholipid acyltransferase (LPLAT)-like uncharacterized protein